MSASQRPRAALERACLHCQRRKTRCVPEGNNRSCRYCAKVGKNCVFSGPPARTALTRKNLNAIESRCRLLEAHLKRLQPSLDLEDLTGARHDLEGVDGPENVLATAVESDAQGPLPSGISSIQRSAQNPTRSSTQESARDFEWQESFDSGSGDGIHHEGRDGMASLTATSNDSGYLGISKECSDEKSRPDFAYREDLGFQLA
jgi:transcriptional regulatory protein GAL4